MAVEIRIEKGNNVIELLKDSDFLRKWTDLANLMSSPTLFQEPPFVISWYYQYISQYKPLLILGYNSASQLIGIIPLALYLKENKLEIAGTYQAEYHGWICHKNFYDDFLIEALINIKKHFRLEKKWFWSWLPPGIDTKWLYSQRLKKENIFAKTSIENSPVLDLSNYEIIEKLKKSRSIKTKMNRFNKRGNFYIERITSKDKARKILNILEPQCEFRQMAVNQFTPFISDPLRKEFLINKLNYPENNHFTVLWLDKKPIAFNYGDSNSDTVFLGLVSYDPLEGKNSPGIIFIIKLAEFLKEEGYRYFDLTPGGDSYKQKFCNLYQDISILNIYFNRKEKLISDFKDFLKSKTKNSLLSLKIDATRALRILTTPLKLIKSSPNKIAHSLKSALYNKTEISFFIADINKIKIEDYNRNLQMTINKYSDFFLYKNNNHLEIEDVFSNALKQFERENKVYNLVVDGELIDYLWVTKKLNNYKIPEFDKQLKPTENFLLIFDPLSKTYNKDLLLFAIENILANSESLGIEKVLIKLNKPDSFLTELIKNIGFKPYQKISRTKIFSFIQRIETID